MLVKNKSQKAESFRVKEAMLREAIANEIMNIAHSRVKKKEMIKNEEDINFLEMQHEDPSSAVWVLPI